MTYTSIDNAQHLSPLDTGQDRNSSDQVTPSAPAHASASNDQLNLQDMSDYPQERHLTVTASGVPTGKGKGVTSKPMSIPPPTVVAHDYFDIDHPFLTIPSTSSPLTPSSLHQYYLRATDNVADIAYPAAHQSTDPVSLSPPLFDDLAWKGKDREIPPVLPPLDFTNTEFTCNDTFWTSPAISSPGPSSYTSPFPPELLDAHSQDIPGSQDGDEGELSPIMLPKSAAALRRMPSRPRSLSNLPMRSAESLATVSLTKARPMLGSPRMSSQPRFPKASEAEDACSPPGAGTRARAILEPWFSGLKVDELDATIARLRSQEVVPTLSLKPKGRSKSYPFPPSALDYIPIASTDLFVPLPLIVRNFFDDDLSRELRLRILSFLPSLHEADHHRAVREGRWCVAKASSSRGKWVGREKGFRELVKLSRVSKAWQTLVFDGQLWVDIDIRSYPNIPDSLLRLTGTGGSFSKTLNIGGQAQVASDTFIKIVDNLRCKFDTGDMSDTQLTTINLQGCTSVTTRSLHHLLTHSPCLENLCLKGLVGVTNTTCDILSTYCQNLVSLNMNRCPNMDASGIRTIASTAITRGERLRLKELRVSGIKNMDDFVLRALGKAAPYLEVLDLSYARQLHNSALEEFVACDYRSADEDPEIKTIVVSVRDLGRDPGDGMYKLRRRVTRLRHLCLSYCPMLTDETCSNLAHSVPELEFLEMAGIGADLKDEGLIRLLETTPRIRRLDLEDASDITDNVLVALSPKMHVDLPPAEDPGYMLEHLVVSYATNITDAALLALIRGRHKMKHLEADNTRIGSSVLREFVRLSRERKMVNAKIVAVDCRGIHESLVKDLSSSTRPRMGWRAHAARKLAYLDARDENEDELKVAGGQDECDEMRVVLKSFYSWQTVDAVKAAREKRRKASAAGADGRVDERERGMRWWSPGGGRTRSTSTTPLTGDNGNDGCIIA